MGRASWLVVVTSGCTLFAPKNEPKPVDAATDAVIDGLFCTGPSATCYESGMAMATTIACSLEPVTSCDQRLVRYCDCAPGNATGGVLVFPSEMTPMTDTDVIYVNGDGLGGLSMSIEDAVGGGFICLGTAAPCSINQAVCSGTTALYTWKVSRGPGTHRITIYRDQANPPCDAARKLTTVTVTH